MVAAMNAVGVDGALLVSPWSMYRFDASYALEVYDRHPDRFGLIKPFDPGVENNANEIKLWAATPGVVGARIMLTNEVAQDPESKGLNEILAAGSQHDLPVNILCWGHLSLLGELARRHSQTSIVIDHIGLVQPFAPPPPEKPFADLDKVIALSQYDNVSIKISGACTLSNQPFPYDDIWPHLSRIFEAFGIDRCMWGTDWTRAVELLTCKEGVEAFRLMDQLSDSERSMLMGGSLSRIYNWAPGN